jgi:NAD-reducing hydrogenase large subunit
MQDWAMDALALARDYILEHLEMVGDFADFPSPYLSLARSATGRSTSTTARCGSSTGTAALIFDRIPCEDYARILREDVRAWSYMKFPVLKDLGPDEGWYRVGPLARMNTVDRIDTPLAEAARQDADRPLHGRVRRDPVQSLGAHDRGGIASRRSASCCNDPDLQGTDLVAQGRAPRRRVGVIEAPRGTLIHHYEVDENDQVTYCNLIVSTTHNNEAMNRAVRDVAEKHLSGRRRSPKAC